MMLGQQCRHCHIPSVYATATSCSEPRVYDFGGNRSDKGAAKISQRNVKWDHMDVCQIMFKIQKQNLIYHTCKHLMFTHLCFYCRYLWLFLCLSLQENNSFGAWHIAHTQKSVIVSLKKAAIYRCCRYRCIKMICHRNERVLNRVCT